MKLSLTVILVMTFCCLGFADIVYLKNGEIIENATITEITPTDIKYKIGERVVVYTISKNDAIKIVYSDGTEDVFSAEEAKIDTSLITVTAGYSGLGLNTFVYWDWRKIDPYYFYIAGLGLGFVEKGFIAASVDLQYGWPLPNQSYIALGVNPRISLDRFEFITYVGYIYKQWLFNLGYSVGLEEAFNKFNSLSLNAGYIFESIGEKKEETPEKSSSRYFRPGIEINYLVYHSAVKNFDDYSLTDPTSGAAEAGLFLRIGPEYGYFTTGAYAKLEGLDKEGFVSKDIKIYGINIATVNFLDLSWKRVSVEIPLLFSFGSEQIKFTGGTLLDFYFFNEVSIELNEKAPIDVGGATGRDPIIDNDTPYGDLYLVLGLDIDIVKHWGIGAKCLIWGTSLGEAKKGGLYDVLGIEPARFQTRISTYYVF